MTKSSSQGNLLYNNQNSFKAEMIRRGFSYNQVYKKSGGRIGLQKGAHLKPQMPGAEPEKVIS